MQLLQAKVRSLQGVVDSGWFKPGRNVTLFLGQKRQTVSQILVGLEALNPLYDLFLVDPLRNYQQTWQQLDYQRPVVVEKKTAVFTVFSSEPELVRALAYLDDSFFETDRIELGRRLDYSRWISFVELSASARWSDITEAMHALRSTRQAYEKDSGLADEAFFHTCKRSDRIKGELAQKCREWLTANGPCWTGDFDELRNTSLEKVNLHERFKLAAKIVEEYLPPMVCLQPTTILKGKYSFAEVMSKNAGLDPVTALLQRVCIRFALPSLNRKGLDLVRQRISEISSILPLAQFSIELTIAESGFVLADVEKHEGKPLAKRMFLLWFVALLTKLLWQQFPIFLLDRYDWHLSDVESCGLAGCLAELGTITQILMSLDQVENQRDYGFAKVLGVTTDGVVE